VITGAAYGNDDIGYATTHEFVTTLDTGSTTIEYPAALQTTATTITEVGDIWCADAANCLALANRHPYGDNLPKVQFRLRAAHLTGGAWSTTAITAPPGFTGLGLTSLWCETLTSCIAVGSAWNNYDQPGDQPDAVPMVASLVGTTWTVTTLALPAGMEVAVLSDVDCRSAANCVAVGFASSASGNHVGFVATRSNGAWASQILPVTSGDEGGEDLSGVSCPSSEVCIAVGIGDAADLLDDRPVVAKLVGGTWTKQVLVNALPAGEQWPIVSVSCQTETSCVAVGNDWVWTSDGTTWVPSGAPSPLDGSAPWLYGLDCPSSTSCIATGYFTFYGTDTYRPLIENFVAG
jgi:hypothetical protein